MSLPLLILIYRKGEYCEKGIISGVINPQRAPCSNANKMNDNRSISELSALLFHTRKIEEIEAAAKAIAELDASEARETLLAYVEYPRPLNYKVWPYAASFLREEDAFWLLEIDKEYRRNSRMAAKYKIPEEARRVVTGYLENNIKQAQAALLIEASNSRYREISEIAFQLMLEYDTSNIREALRKLVSQYSVANKPTRPRKALESLVARVEVDEQIELLSDIVSARFGFLSTKDYAKELLLQLNRKVYVKTILEKDQIEAEDIKHLKEDGRREAINRIFEIIDNYYSTGSFGATEKAAVWALAEIGGEEAEEALISLYKQAKGIRDKEERLFLVNELCSIFAMYEMDSTLPTLRKIADSWRRLKIVKKDESGARIKRSPSRRGLEKFLACLTILAIEGGEYEDRAHPYSVKAHNIFDDMECALKDLDEFKKENYDKGEPETDEMLHLYWDNVEWIEADLTEMLDFLEKDELDRKDDAILQHSYRVIERFIFNIQAYLDWGMKRGLLEALNVIGESDTDMDRMEKVLRGLLKGAASSAYFTDFEEHARTACRLISEKRLISELPLLKELALSIDEDQYKGYWDKRFVIKVAICRAILDLEGVSPRNRTDSFAKTARKAIAKYTKKVEKRRAIYMMADISDGKEDEADFLDFMERQLISMEAILYDGL